MTDVLPVRPFFVLSPADNVWRRTEMLGMNSSNTPETTESGTKRIFRKFYTVADEHRDPPDPLHRGSRLPPGAADAHPGGPPGAFDSYYESFIKDQPDPINDFTQQEREEGGELFHVVHEGQQISPQQRDNAAWLVPHVVALICNPRLQEERLCPLSTAVQAFTWRRAS